MYLLPGYCISSGVALCRLVPCHAVAVNCCAEQHCGGRLRSEDLQAWEQGPAALGACGCFSGTRQPCMPSFAVAAFLL